MPKPGRFFVVPKGHLEVAGEAYSGCSRAYIEAFTEDCLEERVDCLLRLRLVGAATVAIGGLASAGRVALGAAFERAPPSAPTRSSRIILYVHFKLCKD